MSNIKSPYRYDHVGSFLRPEELKQARKDFKAGKVSREELTAIEDKAIPALVEKQKKAGFHIITDGEYRREFWHLDFMWGFEGVAHENTGSGVQFSGELAALCTFAQATIYPAKPISGFVFAMSPEEREEAARQQNAQAADIQKTAEAIQPALTVLD